MSSQKIAVIGTFLLLGNLTAVLHARPNTFICKNSIRKPSYAADESVGLLLQQRGLEKSAAQEKAKKVFGSDAEYATVWMHNLHTHCKDVSMDALGRAVAKRALFDKKVDLTSYDALVRLVHEIKGNRLEKEELRNLRHVAALNRSLKGQWI